MIEVAAKQWFAVHSRPKMEHVADRELRRQDLHTFYPMERVRRRRKLPLRDAYRVEWIDTPYLPRYLFVLARRDDIATVNNTVGVSTVVYFAGRPLPIPDRIMDRIMAKADEEGIIGAVDRVSRHPFRIGQEVTFQDGSPLAGLVAYIAHDIGGKEVRVWLEAFNSSREVSVKPELLRASEA